MSLEYEPASEPQVVHSDALKSMSLKYEPASEPMHRSYTTMHYTALMGHRADPMGRRGGGGAVRAPQASP